MKGGHFRHTGKKQDSTCFWLGGAQFQTNATVVLQINEPNLLPTIHTGTENADFSVSIWLAKT